MAINILSEQLSNQIAAGEVIERPSSVVKELVENSIDAGASEILVTIEEAGRKIIQVRDNGIGMDSADVVLSLQRHATSKINSQEDLFAIKTLGFRGEALPSIASVSDFKIISRTKNDEISGVELTAIGGVIQDLRDIGTPVGTEITVGRLFFNTPARLKFLKSDQTEQGRIVDILSSLSICHHNISFRLQQNGRDLLNRPASVNPLTNISEWLGKDVVGRMKEISLSTDAVKISGYIGATEDSRNSRNGELFYVNGRRVTTRAFQIALSKAYEKVLRPGRHAVAVIFLDIEPNLVDVNVSPTKTEVRFHNEREIISLLISAVLEQVMPFSMGVDLLKAYSKEDSFKKNIKQYEGNLNIKPKPSMPVNINGKMDFDTSYTRDGKPAVNSDNEYKKDKIDIAIERLKSQEMTINDCTSFVSVDNDFETISSSLHNNEMIMNVSESISYDAIPDKIDEVEIENRLEKECEKNDFTDDNNKNCFFDEDNYEYRYLGQLDSRFLLIEINNGLMIINQHRAHERIIFDNYVNKKDVPVQQFLIPLVLHLDGIDNAIYLEYKVQFDELGFLIFPLSGYSYIVRGMPALIEGDPENVLRSIIDDLREGSQASIRNAGKTQRLELLASMACKGAIKSGKKLNIVEAEKLLVKWAATSDLNICPHGDNITMMVTLDDLNKRFA